MHDKVIVSDSLGKVLREERASEYDWGITESIYILNVAKTIEPIFISKQLGIIIRNLNDLEIANCCGKVAEQIKDAMKLGFDKISKYESVYDSSLSEYDNMTNFADNDITFNLEEYGKFFRYIYSKQIAYNGCIGESVEKSKKEDFENIDENSLKMARKVCSSLIVLEIKDYKYLYSIFNKYYSLDSDVVRANWYVNEFILNLTKFINVIFFKTDNHCDDKKWNLKIIEFEKASFDILNLASCYDGYFHELYEDLNISKKLSLINVNYIDSYIENNNQNLNNLLFLVSRMIIEDDKFHTFNYREYNLNLIIILELLLVNSKSESDVVNKFVKNILTCLSINGYENISEEKIILNAIYRYRSCILHGNYPGYTNAMSDLEKLLKYKPEDFEFNKYNTIDYLISKKLIFYVSNIFETISNNKHIIDIIKN